MKMQEATKRETLHIAVGVLGLSVVMNLVFLLLGKWELRVLWSTLLGAAWAVANFFILAMTVQQMAADPVEKRGKMKLQFSYSMRMLATLGVIIVAIKVPFFIWPAAVIPLLFPRITILLMQLLGMYRPSKEENDVSRRDETQWK